MSTLLIIQKKILKTIFSLKFANKKFSLKNLTLLTIFNIKKIKTTIL